MANKERKGNREKRKPKKEKPKTTAHTSSFSAATHEEPRGPKDLARPVTIRQ